MKYNINRRELRKQIEFAFIGVFDKIDSHSLEYRLERMFNKLHMSSSEWYAQSIALNQIIKIIKLYDCVSHVELEESEYRRVETFLHISWKTMEDILNNESNNNRK